MNSRLNIEDDGRGRGPLRWTTNAVGCEAKVDVPGVGSLGMLTFVEEFEAIVSEGNRVRFNLTETPGDNGYSRRHYSGYVSFDADRYLVSHFLATVRNGVLTVTVPRRISRSSSSASASASPPGLVRNIFDVNGDENGEMGPVRRDRYTQWFGVKVDVPGGTECGTFINSQDRIEFDIPEFFDEDVTRRYSGYVLYDRDVYYGNGFVQTVDNGVLTIRIPRK